MGQSQDGPAMVDSQPQLLYASRFVEIRKELGMKRAMTELQQMARGVTQLVLEPLLDIIVDR